jgi:hypothetical protein
MFGGIGTLNQFKLWNRMFARIQYKHGGSIFEEELNASCDPQHKRLIKFIKHVIPIMEQSTYLLNLAVTFALANGIVQSAFVSFNISFKFL